MMDKKKSASKILSCSLAMLLCVAPLCTVNAAQSETQTEESLYGDKFVMVSLGDSYSSGEGNENFYDQNLSNSEKVKSQDWLAHRSENAWSGLLSSKYVEGEMADYKCSKDSNNGNDVQWYFYAASGAVTADFYNKQTKSINYGNKAFLGDYEFTGDRYLDKQLSVFDNIESGETDYVTFSIGGNDLGFVDILNNAATKSSWLNPNKLTDDLNARIKMLNEKTIDDLKSLYKEVQSKAGEQAHIIVAGYPELLDEATPTYHALISKEEAKQINAACVTLDKTLNSLVGQCRAEGLNIYYASVIEGFKTHGAGANDAYIRGIETPAKSQDIDQSSILSSYSCHPNEKGIEVYASAVQAVINEIEQTEIEALLLIDNSGSMSGTPMDETKKAAEAFCSTVFESDTSASVGLIGYSSDATVYSAMSFSMDKLSESISQLRTYGDTNFESGLEKAYGMLASSKAKKRIIVLMSDGMPNEGKLGDELISYAGEIKDSGIEIISMGFFQSLSDSEAAEAKKLMKALASDSKNYFDVDDAENLVYFFGDVSAQISGQKFIYVTIDSPADVKVTYKGETLNSKEGKENTRTSFGSLTFESPTEQEDTEDEDNYNEDDAEHVDADEASTDNRVKILRLKDGVDYNISIEGNGRGVMDYTIAYMDENGEYTDIREFFNIRITKKTKVQANTNRAELSVLKVDSDGDGVTDTVYKAGRNEEGEAVKYYQLYYFIGADVLLIAIFVLIVFINRKVKKKHSYRAAQ